MAEAVFSEDVPTMTRSGFMKSETASPSLRNSGFDTTSKAMSSPRAARAAATSSRTRSAVPTGHGGLVHDDERPPHVLADLAGHAFHKGKIAGTIGTRGRAHGDEGKFGVIQSVRKAGRKPQAAFLPVAADKVFEAGLENMDTPAVEQGHDFRVDVHTADVIAHFGETRRAHKTDVAGADNAYAHRCSFKTVRTGRRARWRRNRIRKRSPAISSTCNHPAAQRQLDFGPR